MAKHIEGSGIRVFRPARHNSLRAEFCRILMADPTAILGRQALAKGFGVTLSTVDRVAQELRVEGVIVFVSGFQLAESVKPAKVKPKLPPRERPTAKGVAIKTINPTIPTSVWDLGRML